VVCVSDIFPISSLVLLPSAWLWFNYFIKKTIKKTSGIANVDRCLHKACQLVGFRQISQWCKYKGKEELNTGGKISAWKLLAFSAPCMKLNKRTGCPYSQVKAGKLLVQGNISFTGVIQHWLGLVMGETVAQRSCGCPIPEGDQGKVGWALDTLVWWGAISPQQWGWCSVGCKVTSNPTHSMILQFIFFSNCTHVLRYIFFTAFLWASLAHHPV